MWYEICMVNALTPTSFPATGHPSPYGHGVVSQTVGASIMPTERQTVYGKPALPISERMRQDYPQRPMTISSPRLAPSAVSSEQALQARALLTPEFQQNVMATRILRTSNLYAETPRFRNQLDILA